MKRIITLAMVLVGAGLGVSSYATAQQAALKVNVPFDFAVGNHVMPSGEYRISTQGDDLVFENRTQKAYLFALAEPGDASTDGTSKLTFDVVQGQYFLRKISSTSAKTSADFPTSKLEKHSKEIAMREAKSDQLAKSLSEAESRTIYAETASR
jgi:hypothetical protein